MCASVPNPPTRTRTGTRARNNIVRDNVFGPSTGQGKRIPPKCQLSFSSCNDPLKLPRHLSHPHTGCPIHPRPLSASLSLLRAGSLCHGCRVLTHAYVLNWAIFPYRSVSRLFVYETCPSNVAGRGQVLSSQWRRKQTHGNPSPPRSAWADSKERGREGRRGGCREGLGRKNRVPATLPVPGLAPEMHPLLHS